jgi:hypothetical protein
MKKTLVRTVVAVMFAAGLVVAAPVAANAQVAPPAPTNCTVTASIHTSGSKVVMDAHIYPCPHYTTVLIDVYDLRGETTLKHVSLDCGANNLATCEKSFNYSYTNPSGKQTWQVQTYATYVNIFDGREAVHDDAGDSY